jgi:hypothetical protein
MHASDRAGRNLAVAGWLLLLLLSAAVAFVIFPVSPDLLQERKPAAKRVQA